MTSKAKEINKLPLYSHVDIERYCEKGHVWITPKSSESNGHGCPYCSGRFVWRGFNDMWTTNPELASLLLNPEDGYSYTQGSGQKVDWKCPDCGELIRNRVIRNIKHQGISCGKCSDNMPMGEKIIYHLIRKHYNFERELSFKWSNGKRYDFYIPSLNMIIETHGAQHYKQSSSFKRTLQEEQANDNYKYELAIANGIKPENYIVIDCRHSNFEYIKNNIINSRLAEIFDLSDIDWDNVYLNTLTSMVKVVSNLWNDGLKARSKISNELKLSHTTITKYLKMGRDLGWCDYTEKESRSHMSKKESVVMIKPKTFTIIQEFESIKQAEEYFGNKIRSSISKCCNGKLKSSNGYIWFYKNRLNEVELENLKRDKYYDRFKSILQISPNGTTVKEWESFDELDKNGFNITAIKKVCDNKYNSTNGYKWRYKIDVEENWNG